MKQKTFGSVFFIFALFVFLSAPMLNVYGKAKSQEPIKIGAFLSLTQFLSDIGNRERDGFNLALDDVAEVVRVLPTVGWEGSG